MTDAFEFDLQHNILSHETEISLSKRIQAGIDSDNEALKADALAARDELMTNNLRLVHKIARRYFTDDPATDADDLIQEGMIGLLTAANRYDWREGTRFSTYAVWWIRQAINRYRETANTVRRPARGRVSGSDTIQMRENVSKPMIELDAPLGNSTLTLTDVIEEMLPLVEDEALNAILSEYFLFTTPMPETWRYVVLDWLAGYNCYESTQRHGLSHSVLYLAKQRIRKYHAEEIEALKVV